jgi:MFS transporter, DHA2 family, multidrug resistance protein
MSTAPFAQRYHKWIAATVVTAGTFMGMLDSTIVDIVLPKMMAAFEVDLYEIQWVLISYFLGMCVMMCCVGWLTNREGSRRIYLIGLAIFTVFSILCGMAPTTEVMNVARFIQGVGDGFMLPTALLILYEVFPASERGIAMGFYGFGALFAPAIGPSLGGLITEHLSWRWIFYINIPVGLIAFIVGYFYLPVPARTEKKTPFDWLGFILMTVWLSSLILVTTKGQEKGWLQSDYILTLVLLFLASFPLFVLWQLKAKHPLLELRVFQDRSFTLTVLISAVTVLATYAVWILLPVYMEKLRGYPTLTAGLVLLPGALASAVVILGAGALCDRWDARAVLALACAGAGVSSFFFTTDLVVSKEKIAWVFAFWVSFVASQYPPINLMTLTYLPERLVGMGSTIYNVVRLIFGSIGTAYATSTLSREMANSYTILASKANYGEPAARALVAQQLVLRGGEINSDALTTIKATIGQYITANAAASAFMNVFELLGLWMAAGILFTIFLPKPKRGEHAVRLE